MIINSVLSRRNARFVCFNAANFYLETPMANPEYVRIKLSAIPQDIIYKYDLTTYAHNSWIYYEVLQGWYDALPIYESKVNYVNLAFIDRKSVV